MTSAKRLAQLAKKCQMIAPLGRMRLNPSMIPARDTEGLCGTSMVAGKGHCVMYTTDGARFEVPLAFLGTVIFSELLRMSREDFGLDGRDGRIMLPCDAAVMEYALCLLGRNASEEMETAFLGSMAMPCHYDAVANLGFSQCAAVCSS